MLEFTAADEVEYSPVPQLEHLLKASRPMAVEKVPAMHARHVVEFIAPDAVEYCP